MTSEMNRYCLLYHQPGVELAEERLVLVGDGGPRVGRCGSGAGRGAQGLVLG